MAYYSRFLCNSLRTLTAARPPVSHTIFGVRYSVFKRPKITQPIDFNEFKIFYFFPPIRAISVLSSSKMLRTSILLVLCCGSYEAYRRKLISGQSCTVVIITGIFWIIMMFLMSYLTSNLIGKMYTNKSRSKIVISSINFKGHRINKTFEREKVVMSDHPNRLAKKYFKQLTCGEENKKYNLYCHRGMKIDFNAFIKIFPDFE